MNIARNRKKIKLNFIIRETQKLGKFQAKKEKRRGGWREKNSGGKRGNSWNDFSFLLCSSPME